jgi:hypothetical protein
MQPLDARGALLRDFTAPHANIFTQCRKVYAEMLLRPLSSALLLLANHYYYLGFVAVQAIFQEAFRVSLGLDAFIWLDLETKYGDFPFLMVHFVMHGSPHREPLSQVIHQKSECCVDEMTQKARAMRPDGPSLLKHRGLMAALNLWSWLANICNMSTERLLSLIRKSAETRCTIERLLNAGFLTQIQSKHLLAGGEDCRRVIRKLYI